MAKSKNTKTKTKKAKAVTPAAVSLKKIKESLKKTKDMANDVYSPEEHPVTHFPPFFVLASIELQRTLEDVPTSFPCGDRTRVCNMNMSYDAHTGDVRGAETCMQAVFHNFIGFHLPNIIVDEQIRLLKAKAAKYHIADVVIKPMGTGAYYSIPIADMEPSTLSFVIAKIKFRNFCAPVVDDTNLDFGEPKTDYCEEDSFFG